MDNDDDDGGGGGDDSCDMSSSLPTWKRQRVSLETMPCTNIHSVGENGIENVKPINDDVDPSMWLDKLLHRIDFSYMKESMNEDVNGKDDVDDDDKEHEEVIMEESGGDKTQSSPNEWQWLSTQKNIETAAMELAPVAQALAMARSGLSLSVQRVSGTDGPPAEQINLVTRLTARRRDLLRISALIHDGAKALGISAMTESKYQRELSEVRRRWKLRYSSATGRVSVDLDRRVSAMASAADLFAGVLPRPTATDTILVCRRSDGAGISLRKPLARADRGELCISCGSADVTGKADVLTLRPSRQNGPEWHRMLCSEIADRLDGALFALLAREALQPSWAGDVTTQGNNLSITVNNRGKSWPLHINLQCSNAKLNDSNENGVSEMCVDSYSSCSMKKRMSLLPRVVDIRLRSAVFRTFSASDAVRSAPPPTASIFGITTEVGRSSSIHDSALAASLTPSLLGRVHGTCRYSVIREAVTEMLDTCAVSIAARRFHGGGQRMNIHWVGAGSVRAMASVTLSLYDSDGRVYSVLERQLRIVIHGSQVTVHMRVGDENTPAVLRGDCTPAYGSAFVVPSDNVAFVVMREAARQLAAAARLIARETGWEVIAASAAGGHGSPHLPLYIESRHVGDCASEIMRLRISLNNRKNNESHIMIDISRGLEVTFEPLLDGKRSSVSNVIDNLARLYRRKYVCSTNDLLKNT